MITAIDIELGGNDPENIVWYSNKSLIEESFFIQTITSKFKCMNALLPAFDSRTPLPGEDVVLVRSREN
jgi:hypothetical protein